MAASAPAESMEERIKRLVHMGFEEAKTYRGKDSPGFTLDELKKMAVHMHIPSSQNKADLVKAIISKSKNRGLLDQLEAADESSDSESDAEERFTKNKHSFPRLCNILFTTPVALQRSNLLATRAQLQHRETGAGDPLFVEAAKQFNEFGHDSGGLVKRHEVFLKKNIDPENVQNGQLSAYKAMKMWKAVRTEYALVYKKFAVSGQSNGLDFFLFCNGDTDVLYLHCALQANPDVSLISYCREGSELDGGLETSAPASASGSSTATPASATKRARERSLSAIAEVLQKRATTSADREQSEKAVHSELVKKNREAHVQTIFEHMLRCAEKIEELEKLDDYDAEKPSVRLQMLRREEARASKQYEACLAEEGVSYTTP
jgi:hypothetical protein